MISLETDRLIIENFKPGDWEALYDLILWYEASEFAACDHPWPTDPEEVQKVVAWFAGGDQFLRVSLKDDGRFIGFFALNPEPEQDGRTFNLGVLLHPSAHGRGIATEAGKAIVDYAFEQLQAAWIVSGTAVANQASCGLLARLGLRKIGEQTASFRTTDDGQPIEFLGGLYAISRAEWSGVKG
ncbi:MAG TPA: GNAT family N-acetyltransferase [Anaerolineaceae bacterium]|jgi:RimJ/RimL family protein N-acetyltransferase|nr:GNAT family N-acetyltransferase [Anaerolineaceae bacterium]